MKNSIYLIFIGFILTLTSCSKCYECSKSSSSSSRKVGGCFDTSGEARQFKKDMQKDGYDCRAVPEP